MPNSRTETRPNGSYLNKEFMITPEQDGKLKLLAVYWDVSLSEVVRHIFREELQQYIDAIYEDAESRCAGSSE
jgi:hypothetical protein